MNLIVHMLRLYLSPKCVSCLLTFQFIQHPEFIGLFCVSSASISNFHAPRNYSRGHGASAIVFLVLEIKYASIKRFGFFAKL
jgi:hypothetical protein